MARESRTSAHELFAARRWRNFASRAYYALYAEVTHALVGDGTTMLAGRNNPKHRTLPSLVGNNLHTLSMATRWRLASLIDQLYAFRVIADYQPTVTFDEDDARITYGLL